MLGARARFAPVSRVEGRLAATGLIFGEVNFAPNPAQHLDGINGDLRQQLVHEARNEQRHFAGHDDTSCLFYVATFYRNTK
jgi:hypothetical protein